MCSYCSGKPFLPYPVCALLPPSSSDPVSKVSILNHTPAQIVLLCLQPFEGSLVADRRKHVNTGTWFTGPRDVACAWLSDHTLHLSSCNLGTVPPAILEFQCSLQGSPALCHHPCSQICPGLLLPSPAFLLVSSYPSSNILLTPHLLQEAFPKCCSPGSGILEQDHLGLSSGSAHY